MNELLAQFATLALPAADWTHEAHLWVAFGHQQQHEFYDACCRIKAGILLLNHAHGTPNHGSRGYHETLTFFWMSVLRLWREQQPEGQALAAFAGEFLHSGLASPQLPLQFYRKEELGSPAFRAFAQPPSLQPLGWVQLEALA